MTEDPLKDIKGSKSNCLSGRKIVLCVTGSISAIESVELARELIRHGAEVCPVMTDSARHIIHPNVLEWATGNRVVTKLSGKTEHIQLAGNWAGKADIILIAPSTANTIGKIASGIDDTPITAIALTGLGSRIPIIIAPSMHQPMYDNPIVVENVERLLKNGVQFVNPKIDEGKAKMADVQQIVGMVIRNLNGGELSGMKIVVTAGPTVEYIDPIRVISNRSSGKMGVALALEASNRGAETTLIHGPGVNIPKGIDITVAINTTEELHRAVTDRLQSEKCDIFISAAAPADYTPEKYFKKKLNSRIKTELILKVRATPKIIHEVKKLCPKSFLVVFRAEHKVSEKQLVNSSRGLIEEVKGDIVVANDVGREGRGFESETNEVFVIYKTGEVRHIPLTTKREIAFNLFDIISEYIKKK